MTPKVPAMVVNVERKTLRVVECSALSLADGQLTWSAMLLDRLFRILPDMVGEFVASHNVEFPILRHLEIWFRRLAADDADVLKIFNRLSICVIDVDRHLQVTILRKSSVRQLLWKRVLGTYAFPGQTPMSLGWLRLDQLVDEIFESVATASIWLSSRRRCWFRGLQRRRRDVVASSFGRACWRLCLSGSGRWRRGKNWRGRGATRSRNNRQTSTCRGRL